MTVRSLFRRNGLQCRCAITSCVLAVAPTLHATLGYPRSTNKAVGNAAIVGLHCETTRAVQEALDRGSSANFAGMTDVGKRRPGHVGAIAVTPAQ